MEKGIVQWFNADKGFGFIKPDTGGTDIFVHISALEQAGLRILREGQRVGYEVINNKGKVAAGELQLL